MITRAIDAYNYLPPIGELSASQAAFRLAGYALCGVAALGAAAAITGTGMMLYSTFFVAKTGATAVGSLFLMAPKTTIIPGALAKAGATLAAGAGLLGWGLLRGTGAAAKTAPAYALG